GKSLFYFQYYNHCRNHVYTAHVIRSRNKGPFHL
ncbi:hypothetical protein CP8484711_1763, partial [Chlamydia psittaci 84-8471/1]